MSKVVYTVNNPPPRRIVGKNDVEIVGPMTIAGGRPEAIEIIGCDRVAIHNHCVFSGSPTLLRIADCPHVLVSKCRFERPEGPADPNGQCIQLIRSAGVITGCVCLAGPGAEDLISIYADKPVKYATLVEKCLLRGRGDSDSSTAICCDGPHCPSTLITGCEIRGARVGVQLAGGIDHIVERCKFLRCQDQDVAIQSYYEGEFGNHVVRGCTLKRPVYLGPKAGTVQVYGNRIV